MKQRGKKEAVRFFVDEDGVLYIQKGTIVIVSEVSGKDK